MRCSFFLSATGAGAGAGSGAGSGMGVGSGAGSTTGEVVTPTIKSVFFLRDFRCLAFSSVFSKSPNPEDFLLSLSILL